MFAVKSRKAEATLAAQSKPLASPPGQARVAPLKAADQTWTRSFSGAAKGVNFQLRIQRDPTGHLHARYQVSPGRRSEGWHLEGQVREDHSFVLKGTENEAVFEGRFSPSGQMLSASFRNREFRVETLRLICTGSVTPVKAVPRQSRRAAPSVAGEQHVEAAVSSATPQKGQPEAVDLGPTPSGWQWQAVKTGLKGFDANQEVQQAILWGAQQLHVNPNDLAAVIGYESAGTFNPGVENEAARRKGKKGVVGLIQFTPSIGIPALNQFLDTPVGWAKARQLGVAVTSVTRDDLLKMTATEQMKFVVLYFSIPINLLTPGDKYDAIYQEILAPGRESEIWYRVSDKNRNYADNSQFDTNEDGLITRLEAASEIREQGFVANYFKQAPGQAYSPANGASAGKGAQQSVGDPGKQPARQPEVQRDDPQPQPKVLAQDFDSRLTQQLETFTEKFIFPVTVSWQVGQEGKSRQLNIRTPYFIFSGDIKAEALANRGRMGTADRQVFNQAPKLATYGKGSAEEMASFTQTLVNVNPFGVPAQNITAEMITGWLKKYGIGVDCSGFVTQALDYATTNLLGKDPHLGDAGVREFRNSGSLHGSKGEFRKVNSPAEVKPGDTMWLTGHIRIVTRVGPGPDGKGVQMMIAESTPNAQLPASLAQGGVDRIGVDKAIWSFPVADRFTWSGVKKKVSGYNWDVLPGDKWKTPNTLDQETFYFSRYQPLDAGRKK